jgi:hypothetical protein
MPTGLALAAGSVPAANDCRTVLPATRLQRRTGCQGRAGAWPAGAGADRAWTDRAWTGTTWAGAGTRAWAGPANARGAGQARWRWRGGGHLLSEARGGEYHRPGHKRRTQEVAMQ